ncbi:MULTISPECIES: diacylglycerol kinase family protein [unclassified Frankia]|uniref:diacylglycerol kinase family protein n=1 Tax=unclassified Frankia TaxID=2632575 RepID=UPI002023E138
MRTLLVVNPLATATTQRVRDVLVSALAADLHLETVATKSRGHAIELAERATDAGVDLVVAFGGDGTVNEIANGLLRAGPVPGAPALAVVPGGSTNVFARALGYSASPVEATGELLEALREGRSRRIGLGHATFTSRSGTSQSRWFMFCAGLGVDAAVVERVERKRVHGRRNTPGLYLRSALGHFVRGAGRRRPPITITTGEPGQAAGAAGAAVDVAGPGAARPDTVQAAVVCNTTPWTYFDSQLVRACPAASFDTGLDLLGLYRPTLARTAHAGLQMLHSARGPHGKNVYTLHDQRTITLTAARELPFQMDGEYIGPQTRVTLRSEPRALRVIG